MLWTVLFVTSAVAAIYILFGYPLLLAVLARCFPKPIRTGPGLKTVSVVIPVYNGDQFVAGKLRSVLGLRYPRELMQILVVSDGSTDSTDAIVQQFASEGVEFLRIPRSGKPSALNAGIARSHGEILLLTDVRQTLDPDCLRYLIECFADPKVSVVSGEMRIRAGQSPEEATIGLYWRFERWIRSQLTIIDSIFGATGAIYAMRRELAPEIPPDTLLDDLYLPLASFFRGYRLVMDKRAMAFDYPTRLHAEFKRKVRTLGGNYQTLRAYPELLGPRNRMWLHFVSYKLARLFLPYIFLLILISSFGLPAPWRTWVLAAQAAFYAVAALDPLVPQRWPLKRLTSTVRTFVVLLLAAACAVAVFFVPPQRLWKETRVASAKHLM